MNIKRIAHVCVYSRDLAKALKFYRDSLGLEVAFEFERQGQPFGYYFKLGQDSFIEVFKGEPEAQAGTIRHIAIEVEDLDGIVSKLRAAGLKVGDKSLGADNTWQAWTADPDGVAIEFHEYTDRSLQKTGGKCIATW